MSYMSEEKATKLIQACLNDMYKASEPSITWAECKKKYVGVEEWYAKHVINEKKFMEIRDVYLKQLPKMYQTTLKWQLLNYAPRFKTEK